jgi:hypothetical protein
MPGEVGVERLAREEGFERGEQSRALLVPCLWSVDRISVST